MDRLGLTSAHILTGTLANDCGEGTPKQGAPQLLLSLSWQLNWSTLVVKKRR